MSLSSAEFPLIHTFIPNELHQSLGEDEWDQLEKVIEDISKLNDKLKQNQDDPGRQIQCFRNTIPGAIRGYVVSSRDPNLLAKPGLLKCINYLVLSDELKLDPRLLAVYFSLGLFVEQLPPSHTIQFFAQALIRVISQWRVTFTAKQQDRLVRKLAQVEPDKAKVVNGLLDKLAPGNAELVQAAKRIGVQLDRPVDVLELMMSYCALSDSFLKEGVNLGSSTTLDMSVTSVHEPLISNGTFARHLGLLGIELSSELAKNLELVLRSQGPISDPTALYFLATSYRNTYPLINKEAGQWRLDQESFDKAVLISQDVVRIDAEKEVVQILFDTVASYLTKDGVIIRIHESLPPGSTEENVFFDRLNSLYQTNPRCFQQIFNYTLFDTKTKARCVDDETAEWWFHKANFYQVVVASPLSLKETLAFNDPLVLKWMTQAAHAQGGMQWSNMVLALKKDGDASDSAVSAGILSILQQEAFCFPSDFLGADCSQSIASIKVAQKLERFFAVSIPAFTVAGKKSSRASIAGDSNPYSFNINSVEKAKAFLGLVSSSRYQNVLDVLLRQASVGELDSAHLKVSALFSAVETSIALTKEMARDVFANKQLGRLALIDLLFCYEEKNANLRASEVGSVSSDSEVDKGRKVMKHDLLGYILDKLDQLFNPAEGESAITFFDCFVESYAKPYAANRTRGKEFSSEVFASPESVKIVFADSHKNKEKREAPFLYWLKEVFAGKVSRKLLERMSLLPDQALAQLVLMHGSTDLTVLANNKQTRDYVVCLVELIEDLGKKSGQTREALYENKIFARLAVLRRWVHYYEDLGTKEHGREFVKKGFAEYLVLNFDEISSGQLSQNTSLRHCFVYGYVAEYLKRDGVQTSYTLDQIFEDDNRLKDVFKNSKSSDALKKTDPFKWWLQEVFAGKLSAQMLSLISALPHYFTETLLRPYQADLPKSVLDIINAADLVLKSASAPDLSHDDESSVSSRDHSGSLFDSPVSFNGQNSSRLGHQGKLGEDKPKAAGLKSIFSFGASK